MSRTKLEILAVFIVVVGLSPERLYSETRTAADLTPEAVGKAINTAQDGDTVQLPAGTAIWSKKAWNSGHSPKVKAVTIQGPGMMPLVKYVISIVASPSISLCTFQYSICGLAWGKVVSSTVSFSRLVRNRSSTDVGSISVLAQLNCSGLAPA